MTAPKEIAVLSIPAIARRLNLGDYTVARTLQEWFEKEDIPTPKPRYKIDGTYYWTDNEANLARWKELWDIDKWLKAEEINRKLDEVDLKVVDLIDRLIFKAESTAALNRRAYKNNRGNSLQDARRRCIELDGMSELVGSFLNKYNLKFPVDKADKLNSIVTEAKRAANIQ